jgi:hypothetical protein
VDAIEELLMSENRQQEVQKLLLQAQALVDKATEICKEDELDGVSFMGQTFRCYRANYDGLPRRINSPDWYTDEYWCSSSAHCEIYIIDDEEEK